MVANILSLCTVRLKTVRSDKCDIQPLVKVRKAPDRFKLLRRVMSA